jgi:hypothetical protein
MQPIAETSTVKTFTLEGVKRGAIACLVATALLSSTAAAHARDCDEPKKPRPGAAVPAKLNAFGCVGAEGAPFAGRYQSIDVFADVSSLAPGRRSTDAKVFGKLAPGLLPPMLSAALVEWTLAWEQSDDTMLLYGLALRPDGAELLVRLRLPKLAGVHNATIRTKNMTTGESTSEPIVCTVR